MFGEYLPSILALTLIQVVGVISPGPDFAVVMRNSLVYSRKAGILTAIGVSFGIFVHLAYIFLGLGVIISKTVWLFHVVKYLGAFYLIYLGIKGLRAQKNTLDYGGARNGKTMSSFAALRVGFLTNATNAKALLYFLSLISAFITPKEPGVIIFIYGAIIFLTTLIWFLIVALCFSHARLRLLFGKSLHWVERSTGCLLIALGIKMLFIEAASL